MTTRVDTGARLHCSLLDVAQVTDRTYGGAGFMIAGPRTVVSATRASTWEVWSDAADERARADLAKLVERLSAHYPGHRAKIDVIALPPQHVGLGTKTSLLLAVLVAVHEEFGIHAEIEQLQALSGRGGTSGIGIHGFFTGGFLVDAGHPRAEVPVVGPSSAQRPARRPLLAAQISVPETWRFHLVLSGGTSWHGGPEVDFFARDAQLPAAEVYEAIALSYHGLLPAVRSADRAALARALVRMHEIGFKARELRAQAGRVREVYRALIRTCDAPVGLSSMGPLLYVILEENDARGEQRVAAIASEAGCRYLGGYAASGPRADPCA